MSTAAFESARLSFRRPVPADIARYEALYGDDLVTATLGGPQTPQQIRTRLQRHTEHWRQFGFGPCVVQLRGDGRFVGNGGLNHCAEFGDDELELGYALLPKYWGAGLATEISNALIRHGFNVLRTAALIAVTLPSNRASCRVIEKSGFRFVAEVQVHEHLQRMYRLNRKDWQEGG